MSEHRVDPGSSSTYAVSLARAGWLDVLNEIHEGLCHDLNGRASSLGGLLHLLREDGSAESQLVDYLGGEVRRLMGTVEVMRSFYGDVEGSSEPLLARDLVDRAVAAHGRHRGVRDVEVETQLAPDLPPFRANPARILRVLLILLTRAAEAARGSGTPSISLRVSATGRDVSFDLAWPADTIAGGGGSSRLGDAAGPLQLLAAAEGGAIEEGGAGSVVLRVPAMGGGG